MQTLWLIWKNPENRRRFVVGTLEERNSMYQFNYIDPEISSAQNEGFKNFPGFDDVSITYQSEKMFSNILTRLPNQARPDYLEILNRYNLEKDSSNMEILKKTKGRLISDNYEFVPIFDKNKIEFDVAGTRYYDAPQCKEDLNVNMTLYLILDVKNKFDECAVKVIYKKKNEEFCLGYVPRYYSKQLAELLRNNVKYSALIECLNFDVGNNDNDISMSVKMIFGN